MNPTSALWPRTAKGTTWWSSSWQDFTAASTAWRSASSPTTQNRCRQPQPSEGVTGSTIEVEPMATSRAVGEATAETADAAADVGLVPQTGLAVCSQLLQGGGVAVRHSGRTRAGRQTHRVRPLLERSGDGNPPTRRVSIVRTGHCLG